MHLFNDPPVIFFHQEIFLVQNFLSVYSCVSRSYRHDKGSDTSCNCTDDTVEICPSVAGRSFHCAALCSETEKC